METDRLRYFCSIAEFESMTKAAEVLNVSHSGLSKAMSILQQETSLQLFRPAGRGIELTKQGREFYLKAKKILELVKDLSMENSFSSKDLVRIGLPEIFALSISGVLAAELGNQVHFFEHDSGQTEVQILNADVDFSITCVPYPHKELEYLKIKRIQMGAFATNRDLLKLPLAELNFVVPSHTMRDNPLSIKYKDGWPTSVDRNCPFAAGSLASALSIVDTGLACIFIPQFIATAFNRMRLNDRQLLQIDLDARILKESVRDVFLVKRKGEPETRAMKIAAKVVRQNC
ncbi:MAG: LysR family transcriptional regulator [Bacteriovorax sp.]